LAERVRVHRGPPPERGTDFVVLELSHRTRYAQREDLLRTQEEPLARWFLARKDHGLLAAAGDLALLQKGGDPRGGYVQRYFASSSQRARALAEPERELTECLAARAAWLSGAEPQLVIALSPRSACPSDLALRIGTRARPDRVDLLCDGLLSPAHFREGDLLLSSHALSAAEHAAARQGGLALSALRSSGAPPEPGDAREVLMDVMQ
jgi:hypothetical protein